MKIGIDISQLAFENTGVANYLKNLVENLLKTDLENEYILFFSSMRKKNPIFPLLSEFSIFQFPNKLEKSNFKIKTFKFPPAILDLLWNKLHILPIENLIGDVDIFITSDWTEPPVKKAKKATIIYDLIIYKHPEETAQKIIDVQMRKLKWVKKETDLIFAISQSTKNDIVDILKINKNKIKVIYPGLI